MMHGDQIRCLVSVENFSQYFPMPYEGDRDAQFRNSADCALNNHFGSIITSHGVNGYVHVSSLLS